MRSDEELVAAHLAGDERAFAVLLERHLKLVYALALRFTGDPADAEDIAQETFYKAWRSLDRFDAVRASFRTWLVRIARNTALDRLRARRSVPFSALERDDGSNMTDEIPDDADMLALLEQLHDNRQLQKALDELDERSREVVLLYLAADTLEAVAQILDEPVNTVKSRYRRAVMKLRAIVHPKEPPARI